ncbi:hypothetical protein [Hyalangium gracile]|uniref:hypothetical protein n=1 Tax=Hyalangium gracile TaxID=394092 RepID=UPI001CC936B0|nr:hypothetical protein [Hyalangium gracile]
MAEASLLAAQLSTVADAVHSRDARLSFSFWNQHGALTLIGFSAQGLDAPAGHPVDGAETQRTLATVFSRYPRRHAGVATLTLQRTPSRWTVDYVASAALRHPEARALPRHLRDFPADTVRSSIDGLGQLLAAVQVPTGGEAQAEVEALLEDGRVEGWRLRLFRLTRGGGPPRALSPELTRQVVQVLLPFTLGLGPRTVRLRLMLVHASGQAQAEGWVESAEVVRPPPPPETQAAFVAEYRAMHELILWRWGHEVKEGARWVAQRGAEELALWYAGGILLKGGGYLARWSGSVMRRALGRGGEAAAGWLRTALARLPGDKKREFERLWAKVELEGERALTTEERTALRGLMERVEQLVQTRLDDTSKKKLRAEARSAYARLRPEFEALLKESGPTLPIHHRRPLEYAHLFPDEDINAAENIAMVRDVVHRHINRAWDRFRQLRPAPTSQEVEAAMNAIDAQFKPWYHHASDVPGVTKTLSSAEELALRSLERLFPS